MTVSPSTDSRYRVLDAWRGICACLVTCVHIPVAHGWQTADAFKNMQLFVDFFFVLSGFVICYAYGERLERDRNWQGFMIRRFGRIYPIHFVVLAGFVGLEFIKFATGMFVKLPLDGVPFTGAHSVGTLISNLALTQAFNLHGATTWNDPAWSIGVEFYTYAIFAAAVLLAGPKPLTFVVLAAVGLAGVVAFSPSWMFTTHDFGFWRCLYGFFLGCLVCNFVVSKSRSMLPARFEERLGFGGLSSATSVELLAVSWLVAYVLLTGKNASSLAAPLVFAVIIAVFAGERGAVSRALLTAPAQALGLWSYSIYMIHMLLFVILKIVMTALAAVKIFGITALVSEPVKLWTLGGPVGDAALVAIYLGLVLVLAKYSFEWIEAPARVWFARLADEVAPSRWAARILAA